MSFERGSSGRCVVVVRGRGRGRGESASALAVVLVSLEEGQEHRIGPPLLETFVHDDDDYDYDDG